MTKVLQSPANSEGLGISARSVLFGGIGVAVYHNDFPEGFRGLSHSQNDIEDYTGFPGIGPSGKDSSKRMWKIHQVAIGCPSFMKTLVQIGNGDDSGGESLRHVGSPLLVFR